MKKKSSAEELQMTPGVGKSIAKDLHHIGIHHVNDLKNRNPEKLYHEIEKYYGSRQDPCVLYTMRCAVYFASNTTHQQQKLKWWYWKDKKTIYE